MHAIERIIKLHFFLPMPYTSLPLQDRFENDEYVYKKFIDILNMYRRGNMQIQDVYEEVFFLCVNVIFCQWLCVM